MSKSQRFYLLILYSGIPTDYLYLGNDILEFIRSQQCELNTDESKRFRVGRNKRFDRIRRKQYSRVDRFARYRAIVPQNISDYSNCTNRMKYRVIIHGILLYATANPKSTKKKIKKCIPMGSLYTVMLPQGFENDILYGMYSFTFPFFFFRSWWL